MAARKNLRAPGGPIAGWPLHDLLRDERTMVVQEPRVLDCCFARSMAERRRSMGQRRLLEWRRALHLEHAILAERRLRPFSKCAIAPRWSATPRSGPLHHTAASVRASITCGSSATDGC